MSDERLSIFMDALANPSPLPPSVACPLYRSLAEHLPAILYLGRPDSTHSILYVSPHLEQSLGFPAAEWCASGDLWARLIHPDDRERVLAAVARQSAEDGPCLEEYRLRARDGRTLRVLDESRVQHDGDGRPCCRQGIILDVTERRRKTGGPGGATGREDVPLRFALLGRAAGRIIHDLRNPLCVIKCANQNLRRVVADPAGVRAIAMIERKVRESEALLAGLLDRSTARKPRRRAFDLGRLARQCVDDARARHPGVAFPFSADAAAPKTVRGDRRRIGEVFANLLDNAGESMPAGGGVVETRLSRGRGGWVVRVIDRGSGIAPEDLGRVFEPFFTRKAGGTGLGLSICREIVERHGGRISVASRPGEGTTARFSLKHAAASPRDQGRSIIG